TEKQPRMSTRLPGGHRFEAMIGKSVDSGLSVSIRINRKVSVSLEDFSLPNIVQSELIEAIKEGESILVSGGTSSGKTTFLKALIQHIPLEKRVLTVEDTRELEVPHLNKVQYVVNRNEKAPVISWPQVIDHLMRSRPDVIIAGELSIANTFALISLLDTGHRGFMTTVHSNSAKLAVEETIPTKVKLAEINIPSLSDYLKKTLDWVVQIQKVQEGTVFKRRVVEIWQPQKDKFQSFYETNFYSLKQSA
ncbi:MAG: Flp pilus assembly complex ATPase component TadA, partial [Alphaproteobacteria bacterium]|nr:Flp pilus assembly complex ATPase component TadA [Alphaproteobacteria bacterium]